ncbi:MAG: NAD(+) diphosphatase [Jatrophihabitantaceae bacterium]
MTGAPPLAAAPFDRAAPMRTEPARLTEAWLQARVLAITPKSATPVLLSPDGLPQLAFRDPAAVPDDAPRRFLGLVEDVPYFAATVEGGGQGWATLRELAPAIDDLHGGLFATAIALEQWHQRHPRCSLCGTPTVEAQAGWTRRCPADASEHFPRTDPAVIMLVHDGAERALLGRGSDWGPGRYSTLAGFVEPGESLEAAVVREVFEEVGVRVTDVRYVASQPWPFPSSLMIGFSAILDGDPGIHRDPAEIAEAGWFTRAQVAQAAAWTDAGADPHPGARLRGISPHLSISRYLIDRWLAGDLP